MRVLIVTGLLANSIVTKSLSGARSRRFDNEVCILPVPVASLMSLEYIASMLEKRDLSNVDLVLIPGLIKGDASRVERRINVKTRKGPKNAADLSAILEVAKKIELSTVIPADELVSKANMIDAENALFRIEKEAMLKRARGMMALGSGRRKVLVGSSFPMRVLAEIVDASGLPTDEIQRIARYYVISGVDIIDVGMIAGGGNPEDAARAVKAIRRCTAKPVSIDTSAPEEIEAAVRAGADLILSINAENMKDVAAFAAHKPVVVTSAGRHHKVAEDVEDRLSQLDVNIRTARSLGFRRIIADPILNPILTPNSAKSICAYLRFRETHPETPVLFGAGNVTELIDADSYILLTTEASVKTRGSAKELVRAVKMITLAKARKTAPEDLGIDLLAMKEKRWKEEPYVNDKGTRQLSAQTIQKHMRDPKGSFKVAIDRRENELILAHYQYGRVRPDLLIKGSDPEKIIHTAILSKLVSRLDHAFYLGRELEKAKIALDTGKSYVQDLPIFFGRDRPD
ncbi:MAG: dihydropteroate synthase-like protein [Candidatus Bathyarchaeota archaeon]|nr:dihydropteroate synthase-like protein [Candidatus Bathyarchaeota archaeon]